MNDVISVFFDTWRIESSEERLAIISRIVNGTVRYDDPRTERPIIGIEALNDYVGMFSANAPGWSAKVLQQDTTADMTRATVAFSGKGPDGTEMRQLGQYFVEIEGGRIFRMVGFTGTGVQE